MDTSLETRRITPPENFPVQWAEPGDAELHWTRDREHNPQPITPMFGTFAALTAGPGRRRTVEVYAEAVVERQDRTINGYDYVRLQPFTGTPAEVAERARCNRQQMLALCARLQAVWEQEWRPALEAHWLFWAGFDLENADDTALAAHLDETIERCTDLYEIHYLMGPPMWFAIDEFEQYYCDLFPGSTPLQAQRLLQGFDNRTLQIGRSLWQLGRSAAQSPAVSAALALQPAGAALAALHAAAAADPAVQDFLAEFQVFVSTYGRRSTLWDWGYPSWEDDPTPLLNQLRLHLAQPERDLAAELAQSAVEREEAVAQARQALAGYPGPVTARFESLLSAAQLALVLTEDHTYYIDFNGFGWAHRVIAEFGRRFAAQGRLAQAGDVFYLTVQELRHMAQDASLHLEAPAQARREAAERWAQVAAPSELGTRPESPLYLYSPDARRMLRYIGGFAADEPAPAPPTDGVLRGQPGSSGKRCGRARVILSLAEAHRLQPGEILVTTTTAPPWTPLFLTAGALVTDAGGLLSHGAVVSREYRIPAVVGTHYATTTLRDGQWIEVDGDAGTVRILE